MSFVKLLAEGRVSPAVDVYEVYRALFLNKKPAPQYELYCQQESFLRVTYVTPGFRQYAEDFLRRLASGEPQIYLLPALFGAGKSHFLAFILHIVALYRRCKGSGECVKRHLAEFGIELEAPTVGQVPNVAVFRHDRKFEAAAAQLWGSRTKDELREVVSRNAPLVIIFDETQYFDDKPGFVRWLQTLAEVVSESRGAYLFVSYALFPGSRPATEVSPSLFVVQRMNHVKVSLDTVRNIALVFRRWAGVQPARVELAPLKHVVRDEKLADFEKRLQEAYPLNPVFLEVLLKLADESVAERTRVQLTRELLRTLSRAYLNAAPGELVTFVHLPEPRELLVIGGPHAEYWNRLLALYEEDAKKVKGKASVSVLRQVLLVTFLARLLPVAVLYPTEDDLVLGAYNGLDVRPVDVKEVLARVTDVGLHVARLGDRYVYWFIGDEAYAIREAMNKFSDGDGWEVVADEVASLLRERAGAFSAVYISGPREKTLGRVRVVSARDAWQRALEEADKSALAVDLLEFGVPRRRNNLFVVRRDDRAELPPDARELLSRLVNVSSVREGAVALGQVVKATEEVLRNLPTYFPDLLAEEGDERLKREMEQLLRSRVERWRERARASLRNMAYTWLRRVAAGFADVKAKRLDEYLAEVAKRRPDLISQVVKSLFERDVVEWTGFRKLGDLWSVYLFNERLPAAPISLDEFVETVRDYCAGCRCLFEVGGSVKWLSKSGCEIPPLDKDTGVAPLMWRGRLQEWAVEAFLGQLAQLSTGSSRFYIVYRRPSGEEVKRAVDELLAVRSEWPFLTEGCVLEEVLQRGIEVRVNGVATPVVERAPGSRLVVEVVATDDLLSVKYRLSAWSEEREEVVSGRRYVFEVDVPAEPGAYALEVEGVFRDGSRDRKIVTIKVKGRCKKGVTKFEVGPGDVLRAVYATSVQDADSLLNYFAGRGLVFVFEMEARKKDPETELSLNARFTVSGAEAKNRALRLLRAVQDVSPAVDAVFRFKQPAAVDEDMVQKFRGRPLKYEVEVEEEC
jgi:hypothetical protein